MSEGDGGRMDDETLAERFVRTAQRLAMTSGMTVAAALRALHETAGLLAARRELDAARARLAHLTSLVEDGWEDWDALTDAEKVALCVAEVRDAHADRARLAAVEALHQPIRVAHVGGSDDICRECQSPPIHHTDRGYPCPTIEAVRAALGATDQARDGG